MTLYGLFDHEGEFVDGFWVDEYEAIEALRLYEAAGRATHDGVHTGEHCAHRGTAHEYNPDKCPVIV
jgi:hypothetical protein